MVWPLYVFRQKQLSAANGGIVMANGVSMYGAPNADPRYVNDSHRHHNLVALEQTNAIMGEHTAVFECINARNNSFNVETVAQNLQTLVRPPRDPHPQCQSRQDDCTLRTCA